MTHLFYFLTYRDLIRLLNGYGASLDLQGGIAKWTPLFFAALCGHHCCVEAFLSIGADKELNDARGVNCLEMVEKEMAKLRHRTRRGVAMASSSPSLTGKTIDGASGVNVGFDKAEDPYTEDLQAIVSLFSDPPLKSKTLL